MLVHPDKNWTIYDDFIPDHADLVQKHLPYLLLRKEIPVPVVESFAVVNKLIEYSYFESRFYDIATLKTVLTFEMALKLRFRELNPGRKLPSRLVDLIKWFQSRHYFEVYNNFYLDAIRKVRNHHAHAETQGYSGAMSKDFIGNIVDLINGLYEDPMLTKYRIDTMIAGGTLLESFEKGMMLSLNGQDHLCFRAWIGFIDNKAVPFKIHFFYCLCDGITKAYYRNNNWAITPAKYIVARSVEVLQDKVILHINDTEAIFVGSINDQLLQEKYDNWMDAFPHLQNHTGGVYMDTGELFNSFEQHLRSFHHA